MTTVIAFICMFGVLVFIHEWGHLIFAKRAGMLAREFAIGFGPKMFSFVRNETVYTIRWLPIGGYVRVAGDDPEIIEIKPGHHIGVTFNDQGKVDQIIVNHKEKHPNAHLIEVSEVDLDHALTIKGYEPDDETELQEFAVHEKASFIVDEQATQIAPFDRQFASKSVGQRAMQLFAGPMMNFIMAIILFIIIGLVQGVPSDKAEIGEVEEDTPAQEAGLHGGDEVIEVDGQTVATWKEFTAFIQKHPDEEVEFLVERDGETKELEITPAAIENPEDPDGSKIGQVGVAPLIEKSVFKSLQWGVTKSYDTAKMILNSLFMLVTGQLSLDALSGPVGIYDVTDQVVSYGFISYLTLTAVLSVNLGIINLVPLPALDGGRLLFVGIEAVRGKPVDPQKEGMVHVIGIALLMLLMIVVTWNDIQRLFS
ncbi:MAG TPA: RIP metalloprotease RseP [Pseudogracilibacillus sp.]|nr:RIP metalloprotease RseP [Pseudogracilibacillus sp.]